MPVIVSVANYKGGVGKTTLTAVLASTLSERLGKKVLLIDADPQANLTEVFLNEKQQNSVLTHAEIQQRALSLDYIMGTRGDPQVVRLTDNLLIIPSHPKYMKLLSSYNVPYERVQKLREDIGVKFEKMDFVFIDLPPQMYGIVKPLSKAANFIITPVSKTYFAITALQYLIEDMKAMPPTEWPIFLGAVLVRFRSNERAAIPEYREKVKRAVEEAYRLCSIKWELEGSGISPAFEAVLYNDPILARIRALPFDTLGNPYIVRVVRGEFKKAGKVMQIAEALAKEFIERIDIALKLASWR